MTMCSDQCYCNSACWFLSLLEAVAAPLATLLEQSERAQTAPTTAHTELLKPFTEAQLVRGRCSGEYLKETKWPMTAASIINFGFRSYKSTAAARLEAPASQNLSHSHISVSKQYCAAPQSSSSSWTKKNGRSPVHFVSHLETEIGFHNCPCALIRRSRSRHPWLLHFLWSQRFGDLSIRVHNQSIPLFCAQAVLGVDWELRPLQ